MTRHLFVISIGSVQDFISAARRTRDLWFGSHLLSEISKAAAKAITDNGGKLIFPALEIGHQDLVPSYRLPEDRMIEAFNVANIVLAELPESIEDPSEINRKARIAAKGAWRYYADKTRDEVEKLDKDALNQEIWMEQVNDKDEQAFDVIPIYSAWVPLGTDYQKARKRLMRLLSGRKSIRDFNSPAGEHPKIPKSSLDGARDSVLTKNKEIRKKLAIRLRLGKGEQLCAVALTKRLGGGKVPFPSVVRVAADPWIRGVIGSGMDAKKVLDEIGGYCCVENGKDNGYSSGTGRLFKDSFGYDGEILYPFRLSKYIGQKIDPKDRSDSDAHEDNLSDEDRSKLNKIKTKVARLQKTGENCFGLGEPDPYLAVLVADGDRMGKAINDLHADEKHPAEKHREFSRNLSVFANTAREIVESQNNGVLVYSGGDDVLAFLPVDKCLQTARKLHDEFGALNLLEDSSGKLHGGLTISIGIAIAHAFEPMEDLIRYGKDAEKAAKAPDRDGLAVHLHKRGGGDPIYLREQWGNNDRSLDRKLDKWASMHLNNELPDKAAYEMRELARVYGNWNGIEREELENLIKADAARILKRKSPGGAEDKRINPKDLDFMLDGLDSCKKIRHLADELILARKLSEVMKIANKRGNCKENVL
jgi:CRISPR-associated protein Cmr2